MSKISQTLLKLKKYESNPEVFAQLTPNELASLVVHTLGAVKTIEQAIATGQLDIGKELKKNIDASIKDGKTSFQAIVDNLDKITSNHKTTTDNLNQKVQDAITLMQTRVAELKDGDDAEVTDDHIQQAAEIASALIELPDFDEMVDTAIKSGGESIVDAINLLPDGDGVEMSKVKGLLSLIDQVKTQIARIPTGQGGTIGKGQVYNFIRQAIADGTISTGGLPDQSGNNGKFLTTDGTDASWATLAGGGDVVGPASAVDSNFAAFDTTTGKLIKDSGVTTATFATAAQGALAATATQPGDNISTLVNDAGYITAETDDQTAAEVPFTPAGNIVATDVQAAIEELDGEKLGVDALNANLILYPTTTASDIGGYVKLASNIADPDYDATAVNVSTGAITTTSQLISSLASEAGIIEGELGVLNNTVIGNIRRTAGSGTATFYFEVYKRSSGGTETLLETSANTLPVSAGTYVQFSAAGLINNGPFLLTDRIVLKFYGNRIAGGSDPTYDFQFGGSIPTRALFPLPLTAVPTDAHNELSGLQGGTTDEYYHLTAAEKTVVENTSGTNTGDQTSIVGITGTKAQYDTSVTDGDFMYIGDAPTAHTHLLAAGATDVTATAAEVNILDGVTATTAELNFVDGVTSNVQTQLNAKAPTASPTLTGTTTVDRLDYDRGVGTVSALGNLGATETIDWATATHFSGNLDSNITFTNSNSVTGQSITLYLTYSGAQRTITWPTTTWLDNATGAAPAAPAASGNVLVVTLQNIGGTIYGSATGDFAAYA